jgi:putative hydrolase of the HAD superfamily
MATTTIRAVAFDAVGTLIHPEPPAHEVYAAVARRYGGRTTVNEIRTRFAAAFAEEERLDLANGLATSEERERRRWQDIVAHVLDDVADPAACFAQLYEHFARPEAWRCEPGCQDLLRRLRHLDYAIALASNYDHRLRRVVAGLPPLTAIETIVISSEVGWRKPEPRFFAQLAAALALPLDAVLYVGDDLDNDFHGALEAGVQALLFDPRGRHRDIGQGRIADLGTLRLPGPA